MSTLCQTLIAAILDMGADNHSPLQISYLPKVTQSVTGRCGSRESSFRDCYLYYTILLSYYQLSGEQATGWKNEQRGSFKLVRKTM